MDAASSFFFPKVWKNEAYEYVRAEKGDGQVRVGRLPNKPRLRPGRAGAKPCLTAPARPVVWASQSRLLPGQSRGFGAKPGRKSTRVDINKGEPLGLEDLEHALNGPRRQTLAQTGQSRRGLRLLPAVIPLSNTNTCCCNASEPEAVPLWLTRCVSVFYIEYNYTTIREALLPTASAIQMASTSNQAAGPSVSNFTSIFETATKEYKKLTKKDLHNHPFAAQFDRCDSPGAVLGVFQNEAQAFDQFRNGDERLMKWLSPTVHILFTFSATLGEGIGLPFPSAKTIFTGIGVLLSAAKDVVTNQDTLVNLFERIQFFLQRLDIYIGMQLTIEMKDVLGKIMAQVLSILALSTKEMTQGRISEPIDSIYVSRLTSE
ncbi:hypothetical protein BJV78DRAFT_1158332 [Lactifluus subvellereus]|nr:hypothetical protein BJV78DRAFT_1158332 [Lactifluus subvellereus]